MRNCKNCYHYHMCDLQNRLEDYQDCNHFKDKSLIVELPCKVGDDIYWISDENNVECQKNAIAGVIVKNDGFEILDIDGLRDKIGTRYCYLTREEAEKALRERENNE